MVHPRPADAAREALYAYLIDRPHDAALLPDKVKQFEAFKMGHIDVVPDLPFQLLTALDLQPKHWIEIARNASWQMTRMNLNTFARHKVFASTEMIRVVENRLRNPELIKRARVFPYQLMTAYVMTDPSVPTRVREALQDAMEVATQNTPRIEGKVYVCPDVSGSMQSAVTGVRKGATSSVRCIDVAALVAATIMRRNPDAEILPFGTDVCSVSINPRDSIMSNAQKLAALAGGGTNCSAPLAWLNRQKATGDLVVYVSDNESWVDAPHYGRFGGGRTETMNQWALFQQRNPQARMVCIDVQPVTTTQAAERADIMNVGGFSDQAFDLMALFASGRMTPNHWVGEIEKIEL
jgi:60 kDa SS-A/Ro ribonucleoprotein